jgi:hypothetical protein
MSAGSNHAHRFRFGLDRSGNHAVADRVATECVHCDRKCVEAENGVEPFGLVLQEVLLPGTFDEVETDVNSTSVSSSSNEQFRNGATTQYLDSPQMISDVDDHHVGFVKSACPRNRGLCTIFEDEAQ